MSDCYRQNDKVEEAPLQRDFMLYDPETTQFFILNSTMAYLWKHCDGCRSLDAIIAETPANFAGVDTLRAAEDLRAALKELIALGLVVAT
jgi:hypothetical protein